MRNDLLDIGGYTILKRIGAGARSTIYLAKDRQNGHQVALKRVIHEKKEDNRIFEQVECEYKVAQLIDHPYVRKCYRLKKMRNFLKVKELLLAMEMFEGQSLEDSPSLSLVDVLLVFRMVANGLHAMHQRSYVHCDIKPNNILINKSGSVKIIDLGQSCKIGTTKRRIQGTPDYIAPEQVNRKPLGPRTDVFNLGATMYWAITGGNVPTLIPKRNELGFPVEQKLRPPHEVRKQLPIGVSKLIMDCVKKDPLERPGSMATVISRLDVLIHSILGNKRRTLKNAQNSN